MEFGKSIMASARAFLYNNEVSWQYCEIYYKGTKRF
jgi:hypothetical protein